MYHGVFASILSAALTALPAALANVDQTPPVFLCTDTCTPVVTCTSSPPQQTVWFIECTNILGGLAVPPCDVTCAPCTMEVSIVHMSTSSYTITYEQDNETQSFGGSGFWWSSGLFESDCNGPGNGYSGTSSNPFGPDQIFATFLFCGC